MEIIVGTAGHIDHGKTALVRALTGTDADRLPEEKQRGITIDIGFAELELDGVHIGFVDVPGHERFVKNMLAGAGGIDLVMLIVAADEGVMPQTREHFEICRLLGIERGIVVLTKSDLVDAETLELAQMDVADLVADSFLENAPVIAVSSVTGSGIEELKAQLAASAADIPERTKDRVAVMPIDRSFTVKGFGAVVTGTLASGEIREGAELSLLPERRRVRVRGVQTHGRSVASAAAGQRTAVNLAGIDYSELSRGMILAEPDVLQPTQIFDAEVEMLGDALRPLRSRQRVRVHIGTAEVLSRVFVIDDAGEIAAGERGFVQFRLESPTAAYIGERFIIRSYSPQRTIGGGRVLLPIAERRRRRDIAATEDLLRSVDGSLDEPATLVKVLTDSSGDGGLPIAVLRAQTGWSATTTEKAISGGEITKLRDRLIGRDRFSLLTDRARAAIEKFHKRDPLAAGIHREALRESQFRYLPSDVFAAVLDGLQADGSIVAEKEAVRLASHQTTLSGDEGRFAERLVEIYQKAGLEPPKLDDALAAAADGMKVDARKLLQMQVRGGSLTKITDEFYFAADVIERLIAAVKKYAYATPDRVIDVPSFKEIAGVSRKYAIPLLEYFDRERVTVRAGDKRVVLK
jgi:selenocysteine-specific elongation factor